MDMCTGCLDITEMLLKTVLKTLQSTKGVQHTVDLWLDMTQQHFLPFSQWLYPFKDRYHHFGLFKSKNLLVFEQTEKLVFLLFGKNLTVIANGRSHPLQPFPKQQILDLSTMKEFTDPQFHVKCTWQEFLHKGRKHNWKGRNGSLWAVCPFTTLLSKD